MIRHLRTEVLKQRSTRAGIVGVVAAPAIAALVALAVLGAAGTNGKDPLQPATLVQVVGAPASVITVVALLLGVVAVAGEYRHQTITTTFLATPRREVVVVAKLLALLLVGAVTGFASVAVPIGIAGPWLAVHQVGLHLDADLVRVAAGVVGSTALCGALGVAVGTLVRYQTTAVAVVLAWMLAVEGVLHDVFSRWRLVEWLPAAASRTLVQPQHGHVGLSAAVAAVVLVGYVLALGTVGVVVTLRRDIT
jgi:ABC-2 type transport system permease protein